MPPQQIQLRRGTTQQWATANPTLAAGEIGVELGPGTLKVGNGTDNWGTLDSLGAEGPQGPKGETGNTGPQGPPGEWTALTQSEFEQLDPPDPGVLYVIIPA